MPMLYVPKMPRLTECIGLYGQNGTGKGKSVIDMMRRMPDRHFHVMDTDASYEFSIYEDDERNKKVIDNENFTIHVPDSTNWEDQKRVLKEIEDTTDRGDWAIFDHLDPLWESVPGWYTKIFLGLDETEYKATVRKALQEKRDKQLEKEGAKGDRTAPLFDQLRDYTYLNPEYKKTVYGLFKRLNGKGVHVMCMAHAKPIADNTDMSLRKRYRPFKEMPAGQKSLTDAVNTMLHLTWDGDEEWQISTAKDRGSRTRAEIKLVKEDWDDFTKVYLSPVAGWHMEKVD